MFTKKVTDDDNFMMLSSSAQALYLHLSMSADDDGFCNQVSISMFKAHASIQDLQALLEKRYIYQFENGVIVIKHWRMANALRKDRYTPTAFQEELSQLDVKGNGAYTWLPDGCQMVAERLPQDRLGKVSIDEYREEEEEIIVDDSPSPPKKSVSCQSVVDLYHSICTSYPKIRSISAARSKAIKARLNIYSLDDFRTAFENAENSSFLKGKNDRNWTATFDWLIKDSNMAKVLEGNYADKGRKEKLPGWYADNNNLGNAEMENIRRLLNESPEANAERDQLAKELEAFGRKGV